MKVFGIDYDTPDGTCVRDYIHVDDLPLAHLAALEFMVRVEGFHTFNLGNGKGFSVLDVIHAAGNVVGCNVPYEVVDRRPGDPAILVASSELAIEMLGWQPTITELETIIGSAWEWHKSQRY